MGEEEEAGAHERHWVVGRSNVREAHFPAGPLFRNFSLEAVAILTSCMAHGGLGRQVPALIMRGHIAALRRLCKTAP